MASEWYGALYLHLPFCVSRCAYCDFTTSAVPSEDPRIDAYVEDLCLQLRRSAKAGELQHVETVYVGGGTPSHVGMRRLSMLLYTLSLSMNLTPDVECTLEANPESLDERLVRDVWALGVNRLSIGVQSLDDRFLAILGRAHDAASALHAVTVAHERFENVSVDVMCGIPGQTTGSLEDTLGRLIELGVTHVSVYPLTIEPGTPFHRAVEAGRLPEPDEDLQADHMQLAGKVLEEAGFHRYEVASYAREGFECCHNTAYWTGVPYLGIGQGAVSMTQDAGRRVRLCDGQVTDELDRRQMAAEDLMLGMRMARGVGDGQVAAADEVLGDATGAFQELVDKGLVIHADGRWRPTERGWLCGNELYGRLLDLAP